MKLLFTFFFFLSFSALATIHNVPGNWPSIAVAFNASSSGDTIMISPGTYYEFLIIPNTKTGIKFIGAGSSQTIIDAQGLASVIRITGHDSTDAQMVFEGLTIQNGGNATQGGGFRIHSSNVLMKDIAIKNDTLNDVNGGGMGGGIHSFRSSLTLIDCSIKGNYIYTGSSARGSGIYTVVSTLNMIRCNIESNKSKSNSWTYGGGIFAEECSINIRECKIQNNEMEQFNSAGPSWHFGAGFFFIECFADIVNTLITDNKVDTFAFNHYGAGAYIYLLDTIRNAKVSLRHCTIANNVSGQEYGGALYANVASNAPPDALSIINCILWNNCISEILMGHVTPPQISNCVIRDSLYVGTNCKFTDPLFVGLNNYHLQIGSPCINSGIQTSAIDLENNPRPMPVGNLPDIGCYEIDENSVDVHNPEQALVDVRVINSGDKISLIGQVDELKVFSLSGQLLATFRLINEIENQVNIQFLSSGIFVLQASEKGRIVHKEKFVRLE